ncbi:MAG TPA: nitrilase-related carbon-nitrogen hydrolase [Candidatus Saccharimonadales bacterium]|nr:nitrilase-related carbon-nitrogen hydrolase [Candidatus Saccharimonadales bacterium]
MRWIAGHASATMNVMRVGYYQFRPRFGRPAENTSRIVGALRAVRADLIVLPELALSGYYFASREEAFSLSEVPSRSRNVASLIDLCRDRKMHLVAGVAERSRDRLFNSSLLLGPRGVVSVYRKVHLFDNEKRWFDPGDRPPGVVRAGGAAVGMMICFDWLFPEVARSLALQGAEILAHPSNLVLRHCQGAMPARCLENGVFAITCNRSGADRRPHGTIAFTGRSQITGPRGEVLHRAPARGEALHVQRIDLARARDKRITPGNDLLGDRRPAFYMELTRSARAGSGLRTSRRIRSGRRGR